MTRDRRLLAAVWLATAVIVAVGALLAYHFITRVDALAGRGDPADLYEDPALLFTDPGILGTAVELRVTEAVRSCMADAGYDYRGPAVVSDLDALLDPAADGYGIAAGPDAPRPQLGRGRAGRTDQAGYEEALYGSTLSGAGDAAAGGCAAVGRAALDAALASLGSLPYSIEQLQADAAAHPAWVAGLEEWSACMAERGLLRRFARRPDRRPDRRPGARPPAMPPAPWPNRSGRRPPPTSPAASPPSTPPWNRWPPTSPPSSWTATGPNWRR